MWLRTLLVASLVLAANTAQAQGVRAPARIAAHHKGCDAKAIAHWRHEAQEAVAAGSPELAIPLLQAHDCYLSNDQPAELRSQIAWRISDLAFAYFKAGQLAACYRTAESELLPYSGTVLSVFDEDEPVSKALAFNSRICHAAAVKERGSFIPLAKCSLEAGAFGVPAALLGADQRAACVQRKPDHKDKDDLLVCGGLSLITQSATGEVTRTKLTVATGILADGSVCCLAEARGFARRDDKLELLVTGDGKDCNGGTAASAHEHVYELHSTKLELVRALDATYH